MKTLLIALLALLSPSAFAGNWTYQQIGPLGWYNGTDGNYTTQQYFGGQLGSWSGYDRNGGYHSGSWTRFGNNIYGSGN